MADSVSVEVDLEAAERRLEAKSTNLSSTLKLVKAVRNEILPSLDEAIASSVSAENARSLRKARELIVKAMEIVLGEDSIEPESHLPSAELSSAQTKKADKKSRPFGINAVMASLLQPILTQDSLPRSLEEAVRAKWGTDWEIQTFYVPGKGHQPIPEDIQNPTESSIGRQIALAVHRIRKYLSDELQENEKPALYLTRTTELVKNQGLEEVEAAIKSWGVVYPPKNSG